MTDSFDVTLAECFAVTRDDDDGADDNIALSSTVDLGDIVNFTRRFQSFAAVCEKNYLLMELHDGWTGNFTTHRRRTRAQA